MIVVHGIPNCDSVRRAVRWLDAAALAHRLRDLRAEPPKAAEIARWADAVGWERLLNRRGTTGRRLPDAQRERLNEGAALTLMAAHPLLIKRPVIEWSDRVTVGVNAESWSDAARVLAKEAG